MIVPFNKNKPTWSWLFHILICIDPHSGHSQMFVFFTIATITEYWFKETAFQPKFQSQKGTERLQGASVGCYHGMNSLLRNRKVTWRSYLAEKKSHTTDCSLLLVSRSLSLIQRQWLKFHLVRLLLMPLIFKSVTAEPKQ